MISIKYNHSFNLFHNIPIKESMIQLTKMSIVAGVVALLVMATFFTSGIALGVGGPVFNFFLFEKSLAGMAWGATIGFGASATLMTPIAAYTSNIHQYSKGKNTVDVINFLRNTLLFTSKTVGFCLFGGFNNLGKIVLSGYLLSLMNNKNFKL